MDKNEFSSALTLSVRVGLSCLFAWFSFHDLILFIFVLAASAASSLLLL